jgi:hypothetical protein
MPRYELVVLTQAKPGREAELRRWYDEHHLADLLKVPGVVSARCSDVELTKSNAAAPPQWSLLALYEIEADDPTTVLQEITRRRQAGEFVWSDALDGEATLQVLARPHAAS